MGASAKTFARSMWRNLTRAISAAAGDDFRRVVMALDAKPYLANHLKSDWG